MTDDICGAPTGDGGECQNPATEGDSCWIDAHGGSTEVGRPSKYSDERADEAIEAAREGLSKSGCARAAGVDRATLLRWLDAHPDFRTAFARAREEGERRIARGGLEGEYDSSMAKFLLATSFGYTEKKEIEHSGDLSAADVTVNFTPDDDT